MINSAKAGTGFIDPAGRKEWREHWPVVLAAMAATTFSFVHWHSMGVMIAPLQQEFGWSRSEITSGLLIVSIVGFSFSAVLGFAVDHFGPRRIALFGVIAYSAALASLSLAQPAIWTWWLLWTLLAFAFQFLTPTVWGAAITSLFSASRGLALSATLSAGGLCAIISPLFTYFLVENFGWRLAYLAWGGVTAIVALPMLYFFFSSAKDKRRTKATRVETGTPPPAALNGVSFQEGVKSVAFFKLAFAATMTTLVFGAVIVNLVPIFVGAGITTASAAAMAGLLGITQFIGRFGAGILLDHMNARVVGAVAVFLPVFSCILFIAFSGSVPFTIIAVLLFGLGAGAELDVMAYLTSRYFGLKSFGALFGAIIGLTALGTGSGPFLASLVYDNFGSYMPVLWVSIPLCLLGCLCLLTLAPYPELTEVEEAVPEAIPKAVRV